MTNQLFFIHIPKAAGSTLTWLISDNLDRPEDYLYQHWDQMIFNQNLGQFKILAGHCDLAIVRHLLPKASLFTFLRDPVGRFVSTFNYIAGNVEHPHHSRFKEQVKTVSDFIWDPILRSHIWNVQTRMLGYDYAVKDIIQLAQTSQITYEQACSELNRRASEVQNHLNEALTNAKRELDGLLFFGLTEDYELSLQILFKKIGWQLRAQIPIINSLSQPVLRASDLSDQEINLIYRYSEADLALYDFAVREFAARYR